MKRIFNATPKHPFPKTAPKIFLDMPRKKHPNTDFGKRLLQLRKARGLTQVQLADATQTTQRAISYYENHASYPPTAFLIELAKALDVSADELLDIKQPTKRKRRFELKPDELRLWKTFQKVARLSDRDQRAVIRLINSLATARVR